MKLKLNEISLTGYKSIGSEQKIPINDDVTVLIGANGVGKSNIISFFQMLGYMVSGAMQQYVAEHGFAHSFLHYGPKTTQSASVKLKFSDEQNVFDCAFKLSYAAGDTLFVSDMDIATKGVPGQQHFHFQNVNFENFRDVMSSERKEAESVCRLNSLLSGFRTFQFNDTSWLANIRSNNSISDNRHLSYNAGNLAAFLYGIKTKKDGKPYYDRIVRYIRQVFPQFDDFVMLPTVQNEFFINLDWKEKGNENIFGAHQISDGTLRFMALATLLLQPADTMPPIIVLDEPELGLHPTAIDILAGMIKKASANAQIVVATQSPRLIDQFSADKIMVVERNNMEKTSSFKKLDEENLKDWLENYSTSELWDKNVIGGRP